MGGKSRYSGWCHHCRINRCNRPRGLCWTCYYQPGIKDQYPTSSKPSGRRGSSKDFYGPAPLPSNPCLFVLPGSADKFALMEGRARRGEQLHHPDEPDIKPVSHESRSERYVYVARAEFLRELAWVRESFAEVYL